MKPLNYVLTDELPRITVEWEDQDLNDFSSILARLRRPDGILITHEADVDDALAGQFHFVFDTDDMIEGTHFLEIRFTVIGGESFTLPAEQAIPVVVRKAV